MQMNILEQLKKMGKLTTEDIKEALALIPAEFELILIANIVDAYCEDTLTEDEMAIWVEHFLPILRDNAMECREKVYEMRDELTGDCQPLIDPRTIDPQGMEPC